MWERTGKGCKHEADGMPLLSKEQGISAPSDPLNGCILPANMTNADEADKIHMLILRKKKTLQLYCSMALIPLNRACIRKCHWWRNCILTRWKIKAGNNSRCHWKLMSCLVWIYAEVDLRTKAKMCNSILCWCMLCLLIALSLWQRKYKVPFKNDCCPVPCVYPCQRGQKWESATPSSQTPWKLGGFLILIQRLWGTFDACCIHRFPGVYRHPSHPFSQPWQYST